MTKWVRGVMLVAAATTSMFCGFAAAMFLLFSDNAVTLAAQLVGAALVIGVGTLTLLHAISGYRRHSGLRRNGHGFGR